jgi:hypothetical protein
MATSTKIPQSYLPAIGALVGILFFVAVFGVRILDPSYLGWQLTLDPGQHYLGWEMFRHEAWHFPLGRIAGYGTPDGSSVVYTDSIPLLAIPLKSIQWLLPKNFQYFGLWMLICYALQGVFGWLLSSLNTQSTYAIYAVPRCVQCGPCSLPVVS